MVKVKEILTDKEHLEIANLRIKILKSRSFLQSRRYYKQIKEIIDQAEKRYYEERATS